MVCRHNRCFYVKAANGDEKVLLDPNMLSSDGIVALSGVSVSGNGKTLAYDVSKSGSDWQQWLFVDVKTKVKFDDELNWIKFSGAVWNKDNAGVYYARYDPSAGGNLLADINFNQKVYFHQIATEQLSDKLVYERPQNKDWGFGIEVSKAGDYLLLSISQGTDTRN